MNNKVTLIFENNEYSVRFNETVVGKGTELEDVLEVFKNEIKNNAALNSNDWQQNEARVRNLGVEQVDINSDYQAMSLGDMKYFHHTGKVFYMGNGKMVQLMGGFEFFLTVLNLVKDGLLKDSNALAALCAAVVEKNVNYSLNDEALSIASAAFSYGMVSYQFLNGKMNKGTASEKCSFDSFAQLVLSTI